MFPATKSVVIIIFLGLLGAGIYGVTHVDEAFKRRILAKDDSYLKQFLTTQEKQFELSVAVSIVETGVIDYEKYSTHENIRALTNIVTENKYYRDRLLSWMDTFSLYAEQTYESITGPNFLPALREFLRIPAFSHFSQDLKFTEDGSKLEASRIFGFMKTTSGSTTQKNAMLTLYEDITEKSELDAFPINRLFIYFERIQYLPWHGRSCICRITDVPNILQNVLRRRCAWSSPWLVYLACSSVLAVLETSS
ncbi:Patched domain-containing protein 3 [Stylophora pistillata]|uniref:Patched domain-containing protein 3 n=1 Tax=Stylophora pistillata TaxID=50429 RepID=A0A2B4SXY9_STYPI|nr:Patched domain-containing protein 3 [Stylophora pistillata]